MTSQAYHGLPRSASGSDLDNMVCNVCNLRHILKPSLHHVGLENIWFVGSNFATVGARGGHTNKLYYFI